MAFITYRVSTTPTLATANVAKGLQLTNSEIDANFKALDDGKLEKNGSAASLTGLPLTTGVTGILPVANGGTGSSTASTGSGGVVLATSPTLVTPNLGIPSFLDLTNARNLPLDGTIAVSGKLPIAFGGTNALATPTAGAVPYGTGTAYAFTAAGTTGQVLTSGGTGTPTWATITTSAGGSNTQLQYNSSGSFAGSANMTFNGTSLSLTNGATIQSLSIGKGPNAVAGNTVLGNLALYNAGLSGGSNTALGASALFSNTSGYNNTANGASSLYANSGGYNNTAIGPLSLFANTAGNYNLALGYNAGYAIQGSNNTIIGSVAGTAGLSDTVIIAAGAAERLRVDSAGKLITLGQVQTPDVTSLLTTANTYPTTRPSLNLDFANSATLDPRITFTRGTNATYTGSDGLVKNTAGINSPRFDWDPVTRECKGLLIEEARTNILTYSSYFDRTWATYGTVTIVPNSGIAPDGSLSATTISMASGAGIYQTVGSITNTTYLVSCWIRGDTAQTVRLLSNTNLSEVTPTTITVTTSWQRITLVKPTTTGTNVNLQFDISSTGAPFQIWGAQIELGAFATSYIPSLVTWTGRASTATYVGSNGLIQTAASGVARYQYNPTNLSVAPFLLLEPAATNLLTYSDDTSNYSYLQDVSITVNQITSPDGSITADKITSTLTGGANTCIVQKQNTIAADTQTYTYSIFVKAGTSPTTTLNLQLAGGTYQQVVGIITWSTNTISTGTLVNYGNGWFKASITLTNNGTNTIIIPRIYVRDQSSANVSGEYAYVWGWQVETGSVATSYIPTIASQVTRIADTSTSAQTTRSADVATMTNSNFSSWYNFTEGTFIAEAETYGTTSYPGVYKLDDNGLTLNMVGAYFSPISGDVGTFWRNAWPTFVQYGANKTLTPQYKVFVKMGFALKTGQFAATINGQVPAVSAEGVLPTNHTKFTIGCADVLLNGHIKRLTYYPTRLSNSTLQALTT